MLRGLSSARLAAEEITLKNVRQIAALQSGGSTRASGAETVGLALANGTGTMRTAVAHLVVFAGWVIWNTQGSRAWRFDPYPFGVLTLLISGEGVLLAIFVLIAQKRLSRDTERRDHLHLQLTLLTEQEITAALRLLREVADKVGVEVPEVVSEVETLATETKVDSLIDQIDREMLDTSSGDAVELPREPES